MGCGTAVFDIEATDLAAFQYPLRAYGLWNAQSAAQRLLLQIFQYPLRAYGLWNSLAQGRAGMHDALSVPSAGLWAVEQRA